MSSKCQEDFVRNKRVIRVNPWVELLQTSTNFILHISTQFQRHVSGNKRDLLPVGINNFVQPEPWLVSRMESHPGPK